MVVSNTGSGLSGRGNWRV